MQKRAARVGFDWPNILQVLEKIEEETKELVEAKELESQEKINEEFGDLMFSIVNLGRHLGVDSEEALKQTNRKFINRFKFVEDSIRSKGKKKEDKYDKGDYKHFMAKEIEEQPITLKNGIKEYILSLIHI